MTQRHGEVSIRAATGDDATAMHALIQELAHTTHVPDKFRSSPGQFREHISADAPLYEALVADSAAGIIGVALYFYTFSSWRGEPGVYLQDLVVTREARGRGLGAKLLRELARVAAARGATHLRLAVERDNIAAQRFYERLGLEAVDTDRIFAIDDDAFLELGGDA